MWQFKFNCILIIISLICFQLPFQVEIIFLKKIKKAQQLINQNIVSIVTLNHHKSVSYFNFKHTKNQLPFFIYVFKWTAEKKEML